MTEYLAQIGCVINASDRQDRRALHFAAYMGHDGIVRALIAKGADVDVKVIYLKFFFYLVFISVIYIIKYISILLYYIIYIIKDRDLYTPLHAAAASGNVECMHTLIKSGADIEAKNVYGNTPLHIACLNGHADAVTELIANAANVGKIILNFENIFIYDKLSKSFLFYNKLFFI